MTQYETRYCTHCGTALAWITQLEDGGDKARLRCPACGWTHWNNPTPVLAAIVEVDGRVYAVAGVTPEGRLLEPGGVLVVIETPNRLHITPT